MIKTATFTVGPTSTSHNWPTQQWETVIAHGNEPFAVAVRCTEQESKRVAHLIAAAPDMLTELLFVSENIGHDSCTGDEPRPDVCIKCCVDRVIHKAMGQQ